MPSTPTTRFGFVTEADGDPLVSAPGRLRTLATAIDSSMAGYLSGTLASRPGASIAGRFYRTTDTAQWFVDNGSAWIEVALADARGKSIISAAESRSSSSFGVLFTPDRVQVLVVPTDSLLEVTFFALWEAVISNTASAAIFVGSNQLTRRDGSGAAVAQAATQAGNNGAAVLTSDVTGLRSLTYAQGTLTEPTTGEAIGFRPSEGSQEQYGGACRIFVAAGTYDISVQFKTSSSGAVTVRNRKLWVRVLSF
jgi:hypothetical protein